MTTHAFYQPIMKYRAMGDCWCLIFTVTSKRSTDVTSDCEGHSEWIKPLNVQVLHNDPYDVRSIMSLARSTTLSAAYETIFSRQPNENLIYEICSPSIHDRNSYS